MRAFIFAKRNFKEIMRDYVSSLMGIGFPVFLIIALSLMKQSLKGMPAIFSIENFAPSMMVFGASWLTIFVGSLMATDRNSSFLMRLLSTPLRSVDYILGYSIPVLPLALLQGIASFATAMIFGLSLNLGTFYALLVLIPVALLFISLGLLLGSAFSSSNAVSGFGTILVNATVFLSGAVLPIEMIGGGFEAFCNALPFAHAAKVVQLALAQDLSSLLPHLFWVLLYAFLFFIPSVWIFKKRMKG